MSRSVNMIIIIGNVGQDPEIHHTNNDSKFATLRVATTRSWMDSIMNERRSETEWHSIITYMKGLVGIIESYVKKGSKVYIRGRIKTYSWDDKKTGVKRFDKRIILDGFDCSLVILDKKESNNINSTIEDEDIISINNDTSDDDLPF